ncbi:MAG: hypothetical protein ACR2NP_10830 [Pirellulaceae bacterium]
MSEKPESTRYIHWQDVAEQLGADNATEIEDYFGTARFEGPDPDESELPPRQTTMTDKESQMSFKSDAPGPDEAPSTETAELAKADQSADPGSDLVIDWSQPATEPAPTPVAETEAKKPVSKKRSRPRKAVEESPAASAPADPPVESHWDDLASTLGVSPDVAPATPPPAASESTPVAAESTESASRSRSSKKRRSRSESPKSHDEEKPAASAFGAGLIDLEATEDDREEDAQKAILSEMFVPSEDPSVYDVDDETSAAGDPDDFDDDQEDELDGGVIIEGDEEFIEFEVEDLEPAGKRPRRRPASREQSREESDRPARGRRSRRDEEERPARSRKRRDESAPASGRSRSNEDEEERPRRRRRRRKSTSESSDSRSTRPSRAAEADLDDSTDLDDHADRKPKKLPTWSETIDVIVEANLASRKKSPRRRRGGRPRRNQN